MAGKRNGWETKRYSHSYIPKTLCKEQKIKNNCLITILRSLSKLHQDGIKKLLVMLA